jgi:hypothetical protein
MTLWKRLNSSAAALSQFRIAQSPMPMHDLQNVFESGQQLSWHLIAALG